MPAGRGAGRVAERTVPGAGSAYRQRSPLRSSSTAGTSRASSCSIRFSAAVVLPLPVPPRNAACWANSYGSKVTGAGVTLRVRPRTSAPEVAGGTESVLPVRASWFEPCWWNNRRQ